VDEEMKAAIKGIYTPHIVPLDAKGSIDEKRLRFYVDWLIERGVHGLYPNGSTGEFTRFTNDERRQIVQIVCEHTAGRVPVLAGAAEANVRETLKACEAYASYGARAVAIVSPFYYRLSTESVYAYFREIAVNVPIDVTLYNIPMFASPIDVHTICRLAEFDRIVGIKDSSGDLQFMVKIMQAIRSNRPDWVFLTGWDAVLVPMLLMGVDGATIACSGVIPEVTRQIYDLCVAEDWMQARNLQVSLIKLFDVMLSGTDFPEGFRIAAKHRGVPLGEGRQPYTDNQRDKHKTLEMQIEKEISTFQFRGCLARS
jgi:dihydrodipicolinate synthase/N-acetylneuraminate lyase